MLEMLGRLFSQDMPILKLAGTFNLICLVFGGKSKHVTFYMEIFRVVLGECGTHSLPHFTEKYAEAPN